MAAASPRDSIPGAAAAGLRSGQKPRATRRSPAVTAPAAAAARRRRRRPGGGTQYSDGLTGLMAVNLIRAHREELIQASTGKLDHMVIDVVGSLFDQILSDSRVPPQMAREIARLQLPVLRVALNDSSFFSTRRHPVRRFINRIASLANAFDDFEDGPGAQFLQRVRKLVDEIIEGDFDQIELYAAKVTELENFIADQSEGEIEQKSGAVTTLEAKESELRVQQRYMLQLQSALGPMALPPYLQEFLAQVWSQALVLAVRRDGADSDRARRYRRVGTDLVMSVQPKGSPMFRKKFLMQLPPLMKDLNEGMKLIGWPEPAQKDFFSKLLPAHAESLKGQPLTELDHNMKVKQLEAIFAIPVPASESFGRSEPIQEVADEVIEKRFTPEEAQEGRFRPRGCGRLVGRGRRQHRRHRPRRRPAAGRAGVGLGRGGARPRGGKPARPGDLRFGRGRRADQGAAAGRPRQARLRLPDAPEGRVAEGPPRPRQLGAQLLRLYSWRQAPGNDLDDLAHAGADVRDRALPRRRERLPDGAGDAAGTQAARRAQGADEALTPPPAASARAMRSAAPRLAGSAMPRPAMSKAVP